MEVRESWWWWLNVSSGHAYLWGEWDGHLPGIARGINHLRIIRVGGLDSEYEVRMGLNEGGHNCDCSPLLLLQWIKWSMHQPLLLPILINPLLILHRILPIMMNHSRRERRRKNVALFCKIRRRRGSFTGIQWSRSVKSIGLTHYLLLYRR